MNNNNINSLILNEQRDFISGYVYNKPRASNKLKKYIYNKDSIKDEEFIFFYGKKDREPYQQLQLIVLDLWEYICLQNTSGLRVSVETLANYVKNDYQTNDKSYYEPLSKKPHLIKIFLKEVIDEVLITPISGASVHEKTTLSDGTIFFYQGFIWEYNEYNNDVYIVPTKYAIDFISSRKERKESLEDSCNRLKEYIKLGDYDAAVKQLKEDDSLVYKYRIEVEEMIQALKWKTVKVLEEDKYLYFSKIYNFLAEQIPVLDNILRQIYNKENIDEKDYHLIDSFHITINNRKLLQNKLDELENQRIISENNYYEINLGKQVDMQSKINMFLQNPNDEILDYFIECADRMFFSKPKEFSLYGLLEEVISKEDEQVEEYEEEIFIKENAKINEQIKKKRDYLSVFQNLFNVFVLENKYPNSFYLSDFFKYLLKHKKTEYIHLIENTDLFRTAIMQLYSKDDIINTEKEDKNIVKEDKYKKKIIEVNEHFYEANYLKEVFLIPLSNKNDVQLKISDRLYLKT